MNQIIKVEANIIENDTVQTVNARELYDFLESSRGFSKWIKERIEQYDFVENQDFILLGNSAQQTGRGGHNKMDYHITLDMAKELSMVERNEKGKQARKYFIECERKMKEVTPQLPNFNNPVEAARAWADAEEKRLVAEEQVKLAKPKIDHYDTVVERDGLMNATQVSTKMGMSAVKMNKYLDVFDVYNKGITRGRIFRQWFIDKGYGITRQTDEGHPQSMFTLKGEAWIIAKFISEGFTQPKAKSKKRNSDLFYS